MKSSNLIMHMYAHFNANDVGKTMPFESTNAMNSFLLI